MPQILRSTLRPTLRRDGPLLVALAVLAAAAAAVWAAPLHLAGAEGAAPAPVRAEALLRPAGEGAVLAVRLPAAGPWRAFAPEGDGPPRLVIDLPPGPAPAPPPPAPPGGLVAGLAAGLLAEGRPRLVIDLARPGRLGRAELLPAPGGGGGALLRLALVPGAPPRLGRPEDARPRRADPPPGAGAPPLAMIDPGHGGIDPGAVRGDAVEKEIALTFARDLAAALEASGRWRVALTRDDDRYLTLSARVALAEAAEADVLLSIHANTVARGDAVGATVFTLSDGASDAEAEALAALENRADAVEGADLAAESDDVARAVIDLSRRRALTRGRALGEALAGAMGAATPMLRDRAHAQAGFRVLTSAAVPSALVELGFLTNAGDLARMRDPAWRAQVSAAILAGLDRWRAVGGAPAAPPGALAALPAPRPGR